MNADFTAEELAFQEEVREFLQDEFPADLKAKVDASVRLDKDDMVRWQKILFKKAGQHLPGRSNMVARAGVTLKLTSLRPKWGFTGHQNRFHSG